MLEPLLAAIKGTTNPDALRALAHALQTLAPKLSDLQKQLAAEWARRVLGWAPGAEPAKVWARVLAMLLPRDPADRYVSGIVEALKYPTTAGSATDVLHDALHDRLPEAAILDGRQPVDLTPRRLLRIGSLPLRWEDQRRRLSFQS
jgi:hypothetical protein